MDISANITFIICTYNRADYLDDTLNSLLQQDIKNASVEILIVDNNSKDDTRSIVQKYTDTPSGSSFSVAYCLEETQGLSHARNRGIIESQSENIVFLDDDILVADGFIRSWHHFFTDYPDNNAAGGKIHVQFDAKRPKWVSHFLLSMFGHHNQGNHIKPYPSGKYPFGGNMGFRKQLFAKVGMFNTELGRKGKTLTANEEKDLFNRIKAIGESILYLPDAALYHRIGEDRATKEYIRKQAEGMGRSMAIQTQGSIKMKGRHYMVESFKFLVSMGLFLVYLIGLRPAKGVTLIQFRYWIFKGYHSSTDR